MEMLKYADIKFHYSNQQFSHSLDSDFGCFAIWKVARPYKAKIRQLFESNFEILLETEIHWSEKNFHSNASRLYETPIYANTANEELHSAHAEKIGDNKFICFIIKDNSPKYTYAQSVSGKIEMSNLNIVDAKYQMRRWIEKDTGIKYGVHSTNNIYEFFFQVPLLLGVEKFRKLLRGERLNVDKIEKDLEGVEGWNNYEELFEILNLTTNYLVQRGFETFPEENLEMDIDFLTDNYQRLASAIGARQRKNQLYKGKILVDKKEVSVDIRFIGDKYYDVIWENAMLHNKVVQNNIFIPRADDYFFSLLFHAKAQKPSIKSKYIGILDNLSKKLNFQWYKAELLENNTKIGELLKGFYLAHGYSYEKPIDKEVYKNIEVIKQLSQFNNSRYQQVRSKILRILPKSTVSFLKKFWKK